MRTEAPRGKSAQTAPAPEEHNDPLDTASQELTGEEEALLTTSNTAADTTLPPRLSGADAAPSARPVLSRALFARRFERILEGLSLDERLGRILLSVVLAILLWFYVTSLENPAQVTQFNGLTVEVRSIDPSLKIINSLPNVNVTVQAPQNIMSSLREADVRPYIELQQLDAGVHDVPVNVDVNGFADRNAMNFSVAPRNVQIQLELQATRVFSVGVQVTGTPPFGYGIEPAQADPSQVKISGSESAINRISQVLVTVDVNNSTATQRGYKTPTALDSSGQTISGLTFEPSTIQVIVPVKLLLNYKLVPVHVPVIGNPAPGYSASQIDLDPTTVTICCAASNLLEPVLSVDTKPVSITGTTSTIITSTELVLPSGIELYPGQSPVISVTIKITTFETTWQFSITPSVVNVEPGNTASVSPQSVNLTLSGTLAQFQSLKPQDITALVDASGLSAGTYQVNPQINIPQGINLVGVDPARISLTIVPPTPTETPKPAPTSTQIAVAVPTSTALPSTTRTAVAVPTSSATTVPAEPPTATHTVTASPTITLTPAQSPTSSVTPGNIIEQLPTPQPAGTPTPSPPIPLPTPTP